jgi:hypothetical protein
MEVLVTLQAELLSHMKQQLLLVRVALVVEDSHDSRGSRSSDRVESRSSRVSKSSDRVESRSSDRVESRDPKAFSPVSP